MGSVEVSPRAAADSRTGRRSSVQHSCVAKIVAPVHGWKALGRGDHAQRREACDSQRDFVGPPTAIFTTSRCLFANRRAIADARAEGVTRTFSRPMHSWAAVSHSSNRRPEPAITASLRSAVSSAVKAAAGRSVISASRFVCARRRRRRRWLRDRPDSGS